MLYYQLTLGPAHIARIRALSGQPDIECIGVQLASRERTRSYALSPSTLDHVHTVLEGVYEDLPLWKRICASLRHLSSVRPDAIIVDSPADPVQWILGWLARRKGALALTRWAATYHDHPRKRWKELLKRLVYRGWDHYLVTGQVGLEYLESFGVGRDRATICGNPVDAEPIESARAAFASRSVRRRSFLFVGRFLDLKNLDRLLDAFLAYRADGGTWELKIAGSGDEMVVDRLRARAGLGTGVSFLGHLQYDDLVRAYLREGCLVLPSYSENWGLVVNEAMHAGMPVLLSRRCGCLPELFREGENGFSFDPFDVKSLQSAMTRMATASEEKRQTFSERSLELIGNHTPARWAERVSPIVMAGR